MFNEVKIDLLAFKLVLLLKTIKTQKVLKPIYTYF